MMTIRCWTFGALASFLAACASSATASPVSPPASAEEPKPPPAPAIASASPAALEPPPPAPSVEEPKRSAPPLPEVGPCKNAVVLAVDRSGSMSGSPIEMAKKGIATSLGPLDARDCYGVVLFDAAATRWLPLAPLVDKGAVTKRLGEITAGGGTDIGAALELAAREVRAAKTATHRGIVLLTDGQSPTNGVKELAVALAGDGVVVSTVGLGGGVDESFLRMIADQAHGRFVKVSDPAKLPTALLDEVGRLVRP